MTETNNRVTLAVLGQKIDALAEDVRALGMLEERVRANEQNITKLTERVGIFAAIQAGLSAVFAAAAAFIGSLK